MRLDELAVHDTLDDHCEYAQPVVRHGLSTAYQWLPSTQGIGYGMSTLWRNTSRGHSLCANSVGFGIFAGVFELFVRCAKILFPWGVCVYFSKSVRKGRFRNVWVRGGRSPLL